MPNTSFKKNPKIECRHWKKSYPLSKPQFKLHYLKYNINIGWVLNFYIHEQYNMLDAFSISYKIKSTYNLSYLERKHPAIIYKYKYKIFIKCYDKKW